MKIFSTVLELRQNKTKITFSLLYCLTGFILFMFTPIDLASLLHPSEPAVPHCPAKRLQKSRADPENRHLLIQNLLNWSTNTFTESGFIRVRIRTWSTSAGWLPSTTSTRWTSLTTWSGSAPSKSLIPTVVSKKGGTKTLFNLNLKINCKNRF